MKAGIDFAGANTDGVVVTAGAGKTGFVLLTSDLAEKLHAGKVSIDGVVDNIVPIVLLIDAGFAEKLNSELVPIVDGAVVGAVFPKLKPN